MNWPLDKIYRYMAFFVHENTKDGIKSNEGPISFEQICAVLESEGVKYK